MNVAVCAYGAGNVRSVVVAFERIGASAEVTEDPSVVAAAGLTGAAVVKSAQKAEGTNIRSRAAEEDLRQQQTMSGKELLIMTEEEKQQMLDDLLRNHHQTVS